MTNKGNSCDGGLHGTVTARLLHTHYSAMSTQQTAAPQSSEAAGYNDRLKVGTAVLIEYHRNWNPLGRNIAPRAITYGHILAFLG